MRMWCVDTSKMCRKHLLGEHVECHMFVGTLNKGISVLGYLNTGLLQIDLLKQRHDELVAEMLKRGYLHNKELPSFRERIVGFVDPHLSEVELRRRCKDCKF
jgi:hypothetical protein